MFKNYKDWLALILIIVLLLSCIAAMIDILKQTNYKKQIIFKFQEINKKNEIISFLVSVLLIFIFMSIIWGTIANKIYINISINISINIIISLIVALLLKAWEKRRTSKSTINQVIYGISVESVKKVICNILNTKGIEYEIRNDKEWTKEIHAIKNNIKILINDKYTGANTPKVSFFGFMNTLENKEIINELNEIINKETRKYTRGKFINDILQVTFFAIILIIVIIVKYLFR